MRTFIALEMPPAFADDVAALARQLASNVEGRFLPRASYHLTLAFLGKAANARLRQQPTHWRPPVPSRRRSDCTATA